MSKFHYIQLSRYSSALCSVCVGVVVLLSIVLPKITNNADFESQFSSGTSDIVTYESSSELPSELKDILKKFPDYRGRIRCAHAYFGVSRLTQIWRLDDASKEMFEFASLENHLVGKLPSEIDRDFWSIQLPWWSPRNTSSILLAAPLGASDFDLEGMNLVVLFDSRENIVYGISIFNL